MPSALGLNIPSFHADNDALSPPGLPLFLKTAERGRLEVLSDESEKNKSSDLLKKSAVREPGSIV